MKQIIQNLKSGETILEDVPAPVVRKGTVLIKTKRSLVSLGTEKMLVEFGKANLVQKARQQPDKVKMVLNKIKTEGLQPTLEAVFSKLNQPLPLGYCNVGEIVEVGEGVKDLKAGDRVVSNGHHAEFVCVAQNLVARIPDEVTDDEASFTVIGGIGLQGIRLLNPTFGETIVVIGLGLIGLLTAQLLKANGCKVIGIDYDQVKVDLAASWGINSLKVNDSTDPVQHVLDHSISGADGVVITASNPSNDIISNAAKMSRKRGRIVLVGVIGLNISRADFYEKELTFQVSCSYGPGRYDEDYEQKGIDYPLPFVRWTERRNFQAILEALAKKQIEVDELVTERVKLDDFNQIYGQIGTSNSIASVLTYSEGVTHKTSVDISGVKKSAGGGEIGVIGAGNFTNAMILPSLKKSMANVKTIASAGGLNAKTMAKKFDIATASSRYQDMLEDPEIELVIITTRHNAHASMVLESLKAGKHVFVEKPLALKLQEVEEIKQAITASGKSVTVGFNRRFSPHMQKVKSLLGTGLMNINATMNAGFIPAESWVHDSKVGGGRIVGEACHYIDLMVFLTGSKVQSVCLNSMGTNPTENTDNASILLKFENGSNGVINYFANGSKSYAKERIEVFSQGKVLVTDNFRKTDAYGIKGFSKLKTKLDKGHHEQFKRLTEFLKKGGDPIIPFEDIYNVSKASILALESMKQGVWKNVE